MERLFVIQREMETQLQEVMTEKMQRCEENTTNLQVIHVDIISYFARKVSEFTAGQLKNYLSVWKKYTSDVEVLETISVIIFEKVHELIRKHVRETVFSQKEQICVRRALQNLRKKGVIKFCEHELGEYISPIFLKPLSDGSYRLILNFKEINSHLESVHFKMETINSVLKVNTSNCL